MIFGLEGVSCVGKTSLARVLGADLDAQVVPCYYHAAPDPSWLPDLDNTSPADQLAAITRLLKVETLRRNIMLNALAAGRHVVLDRTVDTILAHAHAIGRLHGFDCDREAYELVSGHEVAVPDLTLLLVAPAELRYRRAAARVGMPRLLYDNTFARYFHEHFRRPLVARSITLDAAEPNRMTDDARRWVREAVTAGSTLVLASTAPGAWA